jgi:thiol-disulfide isomerase/thioredoxin
MDLEGAREAIEAFGTPKRLTRPMALGLPLAELLAAALLVPGLAAAFGAALGLLLLLGFSIGIGYNLARGNTPDCHCFGQLSSEPISQWTLVRNGILGLAAVFVLWEGHVDRDGQAFHTLGSVPVTAWLAVGGLGIVCVVAVQGWLIQRLFRQHRQFVIRLRILEAGAAASPSEVAAAPATPSAGAPAPDFALPDLANRVRTLANLLEDGKPVFLLFTDPHCVPCNTLMPEIAEWQRDHASLIRTWMISSGSIEDNIHKVAEHGLSNVLLQSEREVQQAYRIAGTPSAVVIRPDATVGSPVAPGPDAIRMLFRQLLDLVQPADGQLVQLEPSLSSRPVAELQPGHPLPEAVLPSLDGGTTDLSQLLQRETLVLFWNTGCGFCRQMLPDLRSWLEAPDPSSPQVVLIATGPEEEIRELGLQCPVLLDPAFDTAHEFGVDGTPMAVLVDADGRYRATYGGAAPIFEALGVTDENESTAAQATG